MNIHLLKQLHLVNRAHKGKNKSKARIGLDFSRTDTEHHSGVQNAYGFQEPYRRQYALKAATVPTYGWFADIVRTDAQIYVVILYQQPGQDLNDGNF